MQFPTDPDSDNPGRHLACGLVTDWKKNLDLAVPEASAASGVYLTRLVASESEQVRGMVLAK